MKRLPTWRIVTRWIFFITSLCLAVYLSQQIGSESTKVSEWITDIVQKLLNWIGLKGIKKRIIHSYIRDYAHFGVHLSLAFFGYRAFAGSLPKFKPALALSLFLSLAIAIFDELIQQEVPGRAFEISDMALNISGISIGTLISILITRIPHSEYT